MIPGHAADRLGRGELRQGNPGAAERVPQHAAIVQQCRGVLAIPIHDFHSCVVGRGIDTQLGECRPVHIHNQNIRGMSVPTEDHLRAVVSASESPHADFLAVRHLLMTKFHDDVAALVQNMSMTGTDGPHAAVVPGHDRHTVHVRRKIVLPHYSTVMVEQKVAAVHFIFPVAIDVADGRDVGRAVPVLRPWTFVFPEDVQIGVEGEHVRPELHDKVLRAGQAAEIRDQNCLVCPVGAFPVARSKPGRGGFLLHLAGFAVADLDDDIGHARGRGIDLLLVKEANHLRMSISVQVVDGDGSGPRGLCSAVPVTPDRLPVGGERAQKTGLHASLVVRVLHGAVDQEVGLTAVAQVTHPDVSSVDPGGFRDAERIGKIDDAPEGRIVHESPVVGSRGGLHARLCSRCSMSLFIAG